MSTPNAKYNTHGEPESTEPRSPLHTVHPAPDSFNSFILRESTLAMENPLSLEVFLGHTFFERTIIV